MEEQIFKILKEYSKSKNDINGNLKRIPTQNGYCEAAVFSLNLKIPLNKYSFGWYCKNGDVPDDEWWEILRNNKNRTIIATLDSFARDDTWKLKYSEGITPREREVLGEFENIFKEFRFF